MQRNDLLMQISLLPTKQDDSVSTNREDFRLPSLRCPQADPFLNMKITDKNTFVLKPICLTKHKSSKSLFNPQEQLSSKYSKKGTEILMNSNRNSKLTDRNTKKVLHPFSFQNIDGSQPLKIQKKQFSRILSQPNLYDINSKADLNIKNFPNNAAYQHPSSTKHKAASKIPQSFSCSPHKVSNPNEPLADISFGDINHISSAFF
ncbi:unnamed protein product [Blepharisma stoltei]|uniref:Exophilin 5 n=1 Tax=Blepharisma stoltei TaxID=1481888 RepID=A0AAU9IZ52_9CILI|nr:unnamed protein product [Blepharisma stoltei]